MTATSKPVDYWKSINRLSRLRRKHRRQSALKKVPILQDFCERNGIAMLTTSHGYQFRKAEYVINWSPSTNGVQIQYALPGHNKTVPFLKSGQFNKPKIMVALEEVIELGVGRV